MIDQIGPIGIWLLPHERDAITLCDFIDLRNAACQAHHTGVEIAEELLEHSGCVARGIDRDENRNNLVGAGLVHRFKAPQAGPHQLYIDRADIWAEGKAEIDQPIFPGKVRIGNGFPILIDEGKGPAHPRAFKRRRSGIGLASTGGENGKDKRSGTGLEFVHGPASLALLGRETQARNAGMIGRIDMKKTIATWVAVLTLWPGVALAQFSESYNFLKAVRDRDGTKATEILSKPGSVIVDTRDVSNGEAALHIVVKRRDATWLAFLLAKGAKPDIKDADGNTPLILATQIGFAEGADLLLNRRAQVDATNGQGETPLILAVQKRDVAMVRLLLASGANPAKTDRATGLSALDYAARDPRAGVILKLLQEAKPARPAAGPR